MSKKIVIPSLNIRSNLSDLFHKFLLNRKPKGNSRYGGMSIDDLNGEELLWLMAQGYVPGGYDDDDDDYVNYYDDDEDVIWPIKDSTSSKDKKGKNKKRDKDVEAYDEFWNTMRSEKHGKRKHSKHKKARVIDINQPYSGMEDCQDDVEYSHYEEIDDDGIYNGKEIYYYPDYHEKDNRIEFNTLKSFNDFCEDNGYSLPEYVANDIMYRRVSHTCLRPDAREYGLYEIMAEDSYGTLFYEVCDSSELS